MQKIRNVGWKMLFVIALPFALACGRPTQTGTSVIRIVIPKSDKLNALGLPLPTDRTKCFGISITSDKILSNAPNSCTPKTGLLKAFYKEGDPISAEVDTGNNYNVEVYMLLMSSSTATCPTVGSNLTGVPLGSLYFVGGNDKTQPIIVSSDKATEVNILLNYTGVALSASFPSCHIGNRVSASNPNGYAFGVASGEVTDANQTLKLRARVGQGGAVVSSATGTLKLKVK